MELQKETLTQGRWEEIFLRLYGKENVKTARIRCAQVLEGFEKTFGKGPEALFSAPGRTELGGNHTDHQHGAVLAGAVDLDILAAVAPNESGRVRILSQGYPLIELDLRDLRPKKEEENTSEALVRGVAARFSQLGCPLEGRGLDAYVTSAVPGGSGLSSSAAFEVLMGTILNELFWDGRCSPVEIAQIGQYAENFYFGKPCGLMDQMASSVGGVVAIDFADTQNPVVEQIALDLEAGGYALCILDSGADHADLTGEYAAITRELKEVCRFFGKEVLREVPEEELLASLPELRQVTGDRAVLRALHVCEENRRAKAEAAALKKGDLEGFLRLVRDSGRSSALYLQNVIPLGEKTHQELMMALALCERLLEGRGAVRVHGGGFAGTVQAFVPLERAEEFRQDIEGFLGKGSCHQVRIRPMGGVRLA